MLFISRLPLEALQVSLQIKVNGMAWRGPPYGFRRQFDEIMSDMQRRFDEMMTGLGEFGQQAGRQAGRMLPALRGAEMHVDVREHGDEVMVIADLPGVERGTISIRLLDPRTLHLATRLERTVEQEEEGYYMRERTYGAMSRTIFLPAEVTEQGAQATFKNGVLEVRLKKTPEARGKAIPVAEEGGMAEGTSRTFGQEPSQESASGKPSAEEQYRREEERYRREQEESTGIAGMQTTGREIMEKAKSIEPDAGTSPEHEKTAEEMRKRKEEAYRAAKKQFE